MRPCSGERGSAALMSIIVVLVVTVFGVAVINFASREAAGSTSSRKEAAIASCVEAARAMLMSQWKLLGAHGVSIQPLKTQLDPVSQATIQGGHYGQDPTTSAYWSASSQTWVNNVQVVRLDPMSLGPTFQVNEMSNRIGDTTQAYRVVVHCSTGDGRQAEIEFGVQYGL